jgi:hypothetical protein
MVSRSLSLIHNAGLTHVNAVPALERIHDRALLGTRPANLSYKRTPLPIGFTVSDQQDSQDVAQLRQVNAELTQSLKRCRVLLDDCRAKLAANSNDPMAFDNDDDEEGADESDRA